MTLYSAKIADLGKIVTGKTPSTKNKENFGGNIPFITPVDMSYNRNVFSTERYVSSKGAESVKGCILPPKTVCVSCIGSDMGKSVITTRTSVTNQQINSVIVNEEHNYMYVYYLMRTLENTIKSLGKNGTAVPILSKSKFSDIDIQVHDLESQCRIAKILSAYDDLIENNQKQIKLLEEAAQRLYKEWFVDLRFPGYKNTPIIDGIPQGWKQKTVEECLAFHGNGGWGKETPTGKNTHPGKVIRGTDINDIKNGHFEDIPTRYHSDNDICSRTLNKNDLVFELSNGNINNIGRCLFIDDLILQNCGKNTICASFCKLLRPLDEFHALILYLEIQDMQMSERMLPLKKHGANGINNFDFEGFLHHELLIPNDTDMVKSLKTIMKKISIIQGEITLLIEARDRLLPKLMSGELEV